jgi:hypothetical protein
LFPKIATSRSIRDTKKNATRTTVTTLQATAAG